MTSTKLDAALDLAAKGFRIFPLIANGRTPAIKKWPDKATADRAIITDYWSRHPNDNIGILTGNGLVVLDEDNKNGKDGAGSLLMLQLEHGDVPDTLTSLTPSGGKHYLLRSEIDIHNSVSTIGQGLDVRGWHGFIVAPGSTIDERTYRWENAAAPMAAAPTWLADLALRANPRLAKQSSAPLTDLDHPQALQRATAYLKGATPAIQGDAGDLTTLKTAMHLKDLAISEGVALDLMLDHYNERCQPPWDPEELQIKVGNAYRYGKNQPGSSDAQADFEPVELESAVKDGKETTPSGFKIDILDLDEIDQLRPPTYAIDGVVTELGFTLVYGAPAAFKSFLTLDWLLCMAYGLPWCGKPTKQCAVLYVAGEGVGGIQKRVKAWRIEHKVEGVKAPFYMLRHGINFTNHGQVEALKAAASALAARKNVRFGYIGVDTVARAMVGAEEKDATAMGLFIDACDKLRRHFTCGLVGVHHTGKDKELGARGSSALPAAVDTEIMVEREQESMTMVMRIKKQKDDEEGPEQWFEAVKVMLPSEDLDSVSSLVLRPTSEEGGSEERDGRTAFAAQVLGVFDANELHLGIEIVVERLVADFREMYEGKEEMLNKRVRRLDKKVVVGDWSIQCRRPGGGRAHRRVFRQKIDSDNARQNAQNGQTDKVEI